eukprot:CAMPEP_0194735666 /NCGR_PEP_ID=MMETSP0296-20130528/74396_1 /TAXON_ID=39354 /ORGANISM="Heterosigma akashiwo, Strain CCMP2393" /LENGTH=76 /DNA_ID=CAMNT_0039644937 /DNA_START=121 /DNA_END=348 /DNA_ORIENTATION=-
MTTGERGIAAVFLLLGKGWHSLMRVFRIAGRQTALGQQMGQHKKRAQHLLHGLLQQSTLAQGANNPWRHRHHSEVR